MPPPTVDATPEEQLRFGRIVTDIADATGISRDELAAKGDISRSAWGGIERGKRPLLPKTYQRLDRLFGWPPGTAVAVLHGDHPPPVELRQLPAATPEWRAETDHRLAVVEAAVTSLLGEDRIPEAVADALRAGAQVSERIRAQWERPGATSPAERREAP